MTLAYSDARKVVFAISRTKQTCHRTIQYSLAQNASQNAGGLPVLLIVKCSSPRCLFAMAPSAPSWVETAAIPSGTEDARGHLKKRRYELGLRQYDVARQLGIALETYANWEKGHTRPYTPSWGRLIAFLG